MNRKEFRFKQKGDSWGSFNDYSYHYMFWSWTNPCTVNQWKKCTSVEEMHKSLFGIQTKSVLKIL